MAHRISIKDGNDNEFFIQQPDGDFFSTAIERSIPFCNMPEQIQQIANDHAQYGFHSDCVICLNRIAAEVETYGEAKLAAKYHTSL